MQWFVRTSLKAFHCGVERLAHQRGGLSPRPLVSGAVILHIYWTAYWHYATRTEIQPVVCWDTI